MSDALSLNRFSAEGRALIGGAQHLADEKHHLVISPLHILAYTLDHYTEITDKLKLSEVNVEALNAKIAEVLSKMKTGTTQSNFSVETLAFLSHLEKANKQQPIGVNEVFTGLVDLKKGDVYTVFKAFPSSASAKKVSDLSVFTRDLIPLAKANKFDPVVGRDKEIRRLFQILGRRSKNNPLMIGETGVGKTAIINALATRIAHEDAPKNICELSVLELELNAIMAGTRARGEVDDRMKKVLKDLAPNTILVINNIENLFTQNGISGTSDILKVVMNKPNIHLLASTTIDGSKKIADKDPGLLGGFSQVIIDPTSPDLAKEIIRSVSSKYEEHHKVMIGENAVAASVRLAKRYLQDKALPGSAIDLLDEAASRKRLEMGSKPAALDDVERRIASLHLQRAGLVDQNGVLREAFVDDTQSVKTLKGLETELAKLEANLVSLRTKSVVMTEKGISDLREECAEVAAKLAKAEFKKETNRVRELSNDLSVLKVRLANAEESWASGPDAMVSEVVDEENVAAVLEDWKGISAQQMCESETEKLSKMEERLSSRVMGQAEAVSLVSKAIRRSRLGLRDANKPIGSFLFLGSSGVGKTELAKALAEFLFDDESNIVRLDMSEFQEKHMISRLLGSPQGYTDSSEGGMLTNAILQKPYSVLLVDEIEKGCPDIYTLFLQILDDARLSSSRGQLVDFSNTVVIFTSNIGTKQLLEAPREKFTTPEGREELALIVRNQLKEQMRPELINRLDKVVLFNPLEKPTLKGIIDVRLRELDRMLEGRELKVRLTDAAKDQIVDESWEPSFGARPLSRSLVSRVRDPLAEKLMSGGYAPGSIISVDFADGVFSFGNGNAA